MITIAMLSVIWGALGSYFTAQNYARNGAKFDSPQYAYMCVIFGLAGPVAWWIFKK